MILGECGRQYKEPLRLKNKNLNNLKVIFFKQASKDLYCDKVWENRIFQSCIGVVDIYSKSLLWASVSNLVANFLTCQ